MRGMIKIKSKSKKYKQNFKKCHLSKIENIDLCDYI